MEEKTKNDYLNEDENKTTSNKSELNEGLVDNHAEMVKAIKAQTAAFKAGQIAEAERHEEAMAKRQDIKEETVWVQACNAALNRVGVKTEEALICGDTVLAGFKERFGN